MAAREQLKFRFAFAGVAHPHAPLWATAVRDAGAELVAVHDPVPARAERFAREHAVDVWPLAGLAEAGVDAVVVDGRNDEVFELARGVLAGGLPLILEKPGGTAAAELEQIRDEAARRGLVLQLGYFLRYADAVAEAKRQFDAGALGALSLARFHISMPRDAWHEMGDWFGDPTNVRSAFQDVACHVVDVALHLLGEPRAVLARRTSDGRPDDAVVVTLDYGTFLGAVDFTACEADAWLESWGFELYGTERTVRGALGDDQRLQFRRAVEAFVRAVRGDAPSPVDAAAGARVFRALEAIAEAADSERLVRFS